MKKVTSKRTKAVAKIAAASKKLTSKKLAVCLAGKHPVEVGGECYACTQELLSERCSHGVHFRVETCEACEKADHTVSLTEEQVEQVRTALVALRQLLQLTASPLVGSDGLPEDSPAAQAVHYGTRAEALLTCVRLEGKCGCEHLDD
jgi:hypothetical protein